MFADGFQAVSFLAAMILVAFALVLYVLFARDKSKAVTIAFLLACIGLSGLFVYLIFAPR